MAGGVEAAPPTRFAWRSATIPPYSTHGLRMSVASSTRSIENNEIDLVGVWRILERRRYWILAALLVAVAVALVYVVSKAPVFESRAKIEIGRVPTDSGPMLIEPPEALVARLLARHGPVRADGARRQRPYLSQASVQKGTTSIVELVAEGDAPDQAAHVLETIFRETAAAHERIHEANLSALTDRLRHVDEQRVALRQHVDEVSKLLDTLKSADPVQASLLTLERGRVLMSLSEIDSERPELVQKVTALQSQSTRLLEEIAAPAAPSYPKPLEAFVLAVVVGLVVGVLLAFAVEFLAYARSAGSR